MRDKGELVLRVDHKIIRELMDSDPKFTVEVKKGIIKSALKHTLVKVFDVMTKEELNNAVKHEIGELVYGFRETPSTIKFNPLYAKAINNTVLLYIEKTKDEITKSITNMIEESELSKNIEKKIEEYINQTIDEKIDELITNILQKKLNKFFAELSK